MKMSYQLMVIVFNHEEMLNHNEDPIYSFSTTKHNTFFSFLTSSGKSKFVYS